MHGCAPIGDGIFPANDSADYRSSALRAPTQVPVAAAQVLRELPGPRPAPAWSESVVHDLTRAPDGSVALGQRIIVHGRVTDEYDRPQRHALIEIWQANAAGRYLHPGDQHDAPLDPAFSGRGAVLTDAYGCYEFLSIEPGVYPWGNHANAWRPKHIHLSLFGPAWASRLVTQMYFPGDPTLAHDPIFNAVSDSAARQRLVATFDLEHSRADFAIAYRFDIVLRGPRELPWESSP